MHIIVNATALASGGGLSILKQFIAGIPEDEFQYILFISNELSLSIPNKNIKLIGKNVKSNFKRFLWDAFGVKKWLNKNNINPVSSISLQNTNFRAGKLGANFIYYHQPMPLYEKSGVYLKKTKKHFGFTKTSIHFS